MTAVACPRCKKPVAWSPKSIFRPFCSERCKNMDFGAWANEEYRIANAEPPDSDPMASRVDG
ncbi:MAG: DNA gyrase inhibitor YacG [Casimicrobium sp.]